MHATKLPQGRDAYAALPQVARRLDELAELTGARLTRGDGTRLIRRVMPTHEATEDAITFVTKVKYLASLATTRAAAVLIAPELLTRRPEISAGTAILEVARPYVAYARVAQLFAPRVPGPDGVHPSAAIDPSAELGAGACVGPFVFVGARARIGEGAVLHAGAHVEADARVGAGTVLYNHVVVRHGCTVGARCILHPGVVIGSDGFGFAQDSDGAGGAPAVHVKIPQLGNVAVEDDVEIGANTCVDRAALGTTRIGAGSKIDNLVQIGHNVELGPGCLLVAQSGIAGSTRLGPGVILAAQAGVSGHLEVGAGAVVLGQAGVMEDVPAKQRVMGSPSVPERAHFRTVVRLAKLDSLFNRVKKLERLLGAKESDD